MRASRRLTASWRARGLGFRRPRCSALSTDEAEQQRTVRVLREKRWAGVRDALNGGSGRGASGIREFDGGARGASGIREFDGDARGAASGGDDARLRAERHAMIEACFSARGDDGLGPHTARRTCRVL